MIRGVRHLLVLLCGVLAGSAAFATDPADADVATGCAFDARPDCGWHFHEDPPPPVPKRTPAQSPVADPPRPTETDLRARLKQIQEALEEARIAAVLDQTDANIKRYLVLQRQELERASRFSEHAQRVVWANPELDSTVDHPVNNIGSTTQNDVLRQQHIDAARALARTDGLFFFFKTSCPYCEAQAPILRDFERLYGVHVLAISLDGSPIAEFPDAMPDNGLAAELGVSVTPAIYMANPASRTITPVAFGVQSESDLLHRIFVLSQARGSN